VRKEGGTGDRKCGGRGNFREARGYVCRGLPARSKPPVRGKGGGNMNTRNSPLAAGPNWRAFAGPEHTPGPAHQKRGGDFFRRIKVTT